MRHLTRITLSLVLLIPSYLTVYAQQIHLSEVENHVTQQIEDGPLVGMAVGYIGQDGNISYLTEGTLSTETNRAVNEHSIFKIASVTKVFTSLAVAKLTEDQNLTLNTEAEKLLPSDFSLPEYQGQKITLQHLVTHTSGLPRLPGNLEMKDIQNPYAGYSKGKLKSFLADYELQRAPGSKFAYSNLGVAIVGHILEEQYGMSYDQVIQQQIAAPLNMESTGIPLALVDSSRYTSGHLKNVIVPYWDFPGVEAMGALKSSVSDMSKFMRVQINPATTVLSDAILKTHQLRFDISDDKSEKLDNVGMGWLLATQQDSILWHNGGTGGYHSFVGFNLEQETGVVVLSNARSSVDYIGFHILDPKYPLQQN